MRQGGPRPDSSKRQTWWRRHSIRGGVRQKRVPQGGSGLCGECGQSRNGKPRERLAYRKAILRLDSLGIHGLPVSSSGRFRRQLVVIDVVPRAQIRNTHPADSENVAPSL